MATRDLATFEHSKRVRRYATALAIKLGMVDADFLRAIETAALFHDIGKLAIPDRLLGKPGPLTPEEYDHVKQHAAIGADLLLGLSIPGPLALLVRHHHEKWDGSGYPGRLHGEGIPAGARVLAIADCYDAMTSDRPYRRAMGHTAARTMMAQRRATMFDPQMIDAFLQIVQGLRPVAASAVPAARLLAARAPLSLETGA
jgi:putative nucleotidyltransferase with HDIG domain